MAFAFRNSEPNQPNPHLFASCLDHSNYILSDICAADGCGHRMLCQKCKETHNPSHLVKAIPLMQVFGRDLTVQIDEAKRYDVASPSQSQQELYAEVDSFLLRIKNNFVEALEDARKYMYKVIEDYCESNK
jgi:hypothetical protein